MKYLPLVCTLFLYAYAQSQVPGFEDIKETENTIQISTNAAGATNVVDEGSISFSIGQVFHLTYNSANHHINEGIQQPVISKNIMPKPLLYPSIEIKSYPNPVDDYFIIETTGTEGMLLTYQIYNVQGKLMKSNKMGQTSTTINATRLLSSIYIVKIMDRNKLLKTLRIIKR